MENRPRSEDLETFHHPQRVRERIEGESGPGDLGDAVLGAIDGGITSFAVVAGAFGGGFSSLVVLVLGFASLLADGFSMAASNYLSTRSQQDETEEARREEERHIEAVPEGQREEIREIFAAKGFEGEVLDRIADVITSDRRLWADTVVTEELGIPLEAGSPWRAGVATFAAFVAVGLVPLLPFLVPGLPLQGAFFASALATLVAFLAVGMLKGHVLGQGRLRAGLETLLLGGGAALLAYGVGAAIRAAAGVA